MLLRYYPSEVKEQLSSLNQSNELVLTLQLLSLTLLVDSQSAASVYFKLQRLKLLLR